MHEVKEFFMLWFVVGSPNALGKNEAMSGKTGWESSGCLEQKRVD